MGGSAGGGGGEREKRILYYTRIKKERRRRERTSERANELERDRQTEREREKEREILILKDISVRSIWTYLKPVLAILQTYMYMGIYEQLINAIIQSPYKYAQTPELNFIHGHTCVQHSF